MQGKMVRRHTNNWMQGKLNNFEGKYGNQDNITKKPNELATQEKSLKDSKKGRKRKYTWIHSEQHKKISNWKMSGHDIIHGFWFKKFTSVHDRLALEMNRYLQEADVSEWMTKGKTTLTQEDPLKKRSKQLQTYNVPIYDVENTNCTNKGRDL